LEGNHEFRQNRIQTTAPVSFPTRFQYLCSRYRGEHWVKSFTTFDHFLCLAYAQLSGRESLRDIENMPNSHRDKLYHVGIRGAVSRSTLADANERRDWRIFQDLGHVLIGIAQGLYRDEPIAVELKQPLYAFDSTVVDLCLSLFPWLSSERRSGGQAPHAHRSEGLNPNFRRGHARQCLRRHDARRFASQ